MYELVRGKGDIETNLGLTPTYFGYPNVLWNERTEIMVGQVYQTARHGQYYGKFEYITYETNRYRLPTINISHLLLFEDFQRLVLRTDPDYQYYPECRTMWPE